MPNRIIHNRKEAKGKVNFCRYEAGADSAHFVRYFWIVDWNLKQQDGYREDVFPSPYVHLTFEHNSTMVWGATTQRYTRGIQGKGQMCGIKFRPGAFSLFYKKPPATYTNNILPFDTVFNDNIQELEKILLSETDHEKTVDRMEAFLKPYLPKKDPVIDTIRHTVDLIKSEKDILSEKELTAHLSEDYNSFKTTYQQYVGMSIPTTIRCYRLQELAAKIQDGSVDNWASYSMHMGYDDQAQFIEDFTTVNGNTPQHFAKSIFRK